MTNFNNLIRSILQFEPDSQVALDTALIEILTKFHADTGTIHRLDAGRGVLVLKAQKGLPPEIEKLTREIPIGKGIAGEAARTGEPVTMCNLQTDASGIAKPAAKKTGMGGSLCVPMKRGDRVVGTLGIGTRREYTYSPRETRDLLSVAEVLTETLAPQPETQSA